MTTRGESADGAARSAIRIARACGLLGALVGAGVHADPSRVEGGAPTAPGASLTGGTTRLDPLLPGGGGRSAAGTVELTASIGQPTVSASANDQVALQSGFWTPDDGIAAAGIFRDGFEN